MKEGDKELVQEDVEQHLQDNNENTFDRNCVELGDDKFIVPEEAVKVIESLPEKDQKTIFRTMCAIEQSSSFKGPLPPPEVLKGYESILPGAFERILSMAEKQQNHRIDIEHTIVYSQTNQSRQGQAIGAFLALFFGIITLILGCMGYVWLAGVIGTSTIIGLATIFVLHKVPKSANEGKRELAEKDDDEEC